MLPLSYTWAPKGHQPEVPPSGIRQAYKVFGLIDYFSGRFFYTAQTGRFNSDSYAAFLLDVLTQTTQHIFVIQDGARYHTSKAMGQFFETHAARLTTVQLPAYSPDFKSIAVENGECMWQLDENVDFFLAGIAAVRVSDGYAYVHLGCRIPLFSMEESADQRRVHLCIGDQDPCRNAAHLLVAFAVK